MLKAQLLWEQDRETLLGELVGTYYKTSSLENARVGGKAQPAKVDQRAQTDFILNRVDSVMAMGYIKKEAGQGCDRLEPSRTGDRRGSRRLRQGSNSPVSATSSIKVGDERKVADSRGFGSALLQRTIAFVEQQGPKLGWGLLSVGLFAGLWEFLWYINVADHRLLPPPHVFLGDFAGQAKNFNTAKRWEIGVDPNSGPTPFEAVLITMASSTMRVLVGLAIAATASLCMGIVIRYYGLFGKLVLPTVTLLAPVSPVAWLPVAIFLFGIGNGPAIFMVFIALFFTMTLATITQIDSVNRNYINVGRTMGASKRQIYTRVILPAILPGLLVVLRLNLFGAWMVVLVAEATGVGYGLGQIISMARNTFNPGARLFHHRHHRTARLHVRLCSSAAQNRVLFWLPKGQGGLGSG